MKDILGINGRAYGRDEIYNAVGLGRAALSGRHDRAVRVIFSGAGRCPPERILLCPDLQVRALAVLTAEVVEVLGGRVG